MSDKDELLPAGIMDSILREAINRHKRNTKPEVGLYRCSVPSCGLPTKNPPFGGVCESCNEAWNGSFDPWVILSRCMKWPATPVDLVETLGQEFEGKRRTPEELITIAQTPGQGQDELARIWDGATKYAEATMTYSLETQQSNNAAGHQRFRQFHEIPEAERVFRSLPRPKTETEKRLAAEKQALLEEETRASRRQSARAAAIRQAQKALDQALGLPERT